MLRVLEPTTLEKDTMTLKVSLSIPSGMHEVSPFSYTEVHENIKQLTKHNIRYTMYFFILYIISAILSLFFNTTYRTSVCPPKRLPFLSQAITISP